MWLNYAHDLKDSLIVQEWKRVDPSSRQMKHKPHLTKFNCSWQQMLYLLSLTTTNDLTLTQSHLTTWLVPKSCKMAIPFPIIMHLQKKEMVSIVATLEEIWPMLLDAKIHVFTDHNNLIFDDLKTQWVLCWHNKIQEFIPGDITSWVLRTFWKIISLDSSICLCHLGAQKGRNAEWPQLFLMVKMMRKPLVSLMMMTSLASVISQPVNDSWSCAQPI